jgi:hypothetical protein
MDRRDFLSVLAAAFATPAVEPLAKVADSSHALYPAGSAIHIDIEPMDYCWTPWVQYIEPGKPVTFDHPFHLRSFGVDAPGKLPDAQCELRINGRPITTAPIWVFLSQNGMGPLPIFPTIAIPAGTSIEVRCDVPDVIFCAQGVMKCPIPIWFDWSDDPDEDDSDEYDNGYDAE